MKKAIVLLLIILIVAAIVAYYRYGFKEKDTNELIIYGNVDIRQVNLGFRVEGRVATMPWQEGDLLTAGQLMGTLDPEPYVDNVQQAAAHLEGIKASLENAELLLKRRVELVPTEGVSIEDYENALAQRNVQKANFDEAQAALASANTNLKDTHVYAPSDGTILTRIQEPGAVVRISDPIYTLSLKNPIWVRAFVTEPELGSIYPGMPAEVYTDTKNLPAFHGQVGFISPIAEFTPKSVETTDLRTDLVYRLRIIVNDPEGRLRQGMPVTVKFKLDNPHPRVADGS